MAIDYIEFGIKVKKIRNGLGYSLRTAADAAVLSKETIRTIESGTKPVTLAILEKLSYIYKTDLLLLLSETRSKDDLFSKELLKETESLMQKSELIPFKKILDESILQLNELYDPKSELEGYRGYMQYLKALKKVEFANVNDRPILIQEIEMLLQALSVRKDRILSDFRLTNIEMVLGNFLGILFRLEEQFERSHDILDRNIKYLSSLNSLQCNEVNILGAAYVNKAYTLHRENKYSDVLELCNFVLMHNKWALPKRERNALNIRKATAYALLGETWKAKSILFSVIDSEEPEISRLYQNVMRDTYGIEIS